MKKLVLFFILLYTQKTLAFWGDGGAGWAQIPYLAQIVTENIKRYQQLEQIKNFERMIHKGIGLGGLRVLFPIDQKTLAYLEGVQRIYHEMEKIYGNIPQGPDYHIHEKNDRLIAESLALHDSLKKYTKVQEINVAGITHQAGRMSPTGAARATVSTNAQILHAINQLIKINGQLLRLQSRELALENKNEKEQVRNFHAGHKSLMKGFKSFARLESY